MTELQDLTPTMLGANAKRELSTKAMETKQSVPFCVELVDERPRPGAWGHDVAFLHPGSTGGVLVEFVEH